MNTDRQESGGFSLHNHLILLTEQRDKSGHERVVYITIFQSLVQAHVEEFDEEMVEEFAQKFLPFFSSPIVNQF